MYTQSVSYLMILFMGIAPCLLQAGITYDPVQGIIRVIDYPAEWPCTIDELYAMDRASNWGKVTYVAATDTCTVDADLWIGYNDGTETYFQIGRQAHPREILQVKGDVVVYPDWIAGENEEQHWWYVKQRYVNRLTLGASQNPGIVATLSLDSVKTNAHGVRIGTVPAIPGQPAIRGEGGQLHVFHGTITALTPNAGHALSGCAFRGNSLILRHATISWISGQMTYGMNPHWLHPCIVEDTIFEHGDVATYGGRLELSRCILRDVQTAVFDCGSLDAVLTDCVFSSNACNWYLAYSDKGLTCIDCQIAPSKNNDVYKAWDNPQTKKRQYPAFRSRRHVVVTVANEKSAPLSNAEVIVTAEQAGDDLIDNSKTLTNAAGKTPGHGQPRAILLTEIVKRATDTPNQPAVREYSYAITARAPGYQPASVKNIKPTNSWQVIPVVLRK